VGKFVREGRIIPAEAVRARADAREIVAHAEAEARSIVEAARVEGDRLREEARREGLDQGRAETAAVLVRARAERARMLAEVRRDIVGLALEVAHKVVGREVESSPDLVAELCERAVARAATARSIVLRVNPADLPTVRAHVDRIGSSLALGLALDVEADDEVSRGGCLVLSDVGRIDARLETQLEAIGRALLDVDDA